MPKTPINFAGARESVLGVFFLDLHVGVHNLTGCEVTQQGDRYIDIDIDIYMYVYSCMYIHTYICSRPMILYIFIYVYIFR